MELSQDDKHTVDSTVERLHFEIEKLGQLRLAFLREERASLVRIEAGEQNLRALVEMLTAKYITEGPGQFVLDLQAGVFRRVKE